MRITESLEIENDIRGYQEVCLDCEAYGLKGHILTRSDCIFNTVFSCVGIYAMSATMVHGHPPYHTPPHSTLNKLNAFL